MKKYLNIVLLFFTIILYAENKISIFEGGNHSVKSHLYLKNPFAKNRFYTDLQKSPTGFTVNPANLAFVKTKMFEIEMTPSISLNLNNLYDPQSKINGIVDDVLDSFADDNLSLNYPKTSIEGGQKGGIQNFAMAFPIQNYGALGFSFSNDFHFDFNYIGNGMGGVLRDSTNTEVTKVAMDIDIFSNLSIDINKLNLGFGGKIYENLTFGTEIGWLNSSFDGNFDAQFEGIIRQYSESSDVTFIFNDAENFRNTLDDSIRINLNANALRFTTGLNYQYEKYLFGLSFKPKTKADLNGNFQIIQHTLGALNTDALTGDSDEEMVNATLFELSKMTYTNRTEYTGKNIYLSYPAQIEFSAFLQAAHTEFSVYYSKFLGEYALHYECDIYENGREKNEDGEFEDYEKHSEKEYDFSIKPNHLFGLETNFHLSKKLILKIATQFLILTSTSEKTLFVPFLDTDLTYNFSNNISVNLGVISFPNPILKFSTIYNF
ncbi:MAG: hypothetical protein HN692_03295 [Candidatus Cloacimonetes bacterium]|nr:hypothetical protein [Candidatus Cloacimonadota bacterium]